MMTGTAPQEPMILSTVTGADGSIFTATDQGLFRQAVGATDLERVLPASAEAAIPVLAVTLISGQRLLAGIAGAIAYSDSRGDEWAFARLPEPALVVSCFASNATDLVVLAGTFEDGILRSYDSGESWHTSNFGLLDASVLELEFDGEGSFHAETSTGRFMSLNGGNSWEPLD
jgi:hypothetical protein